jgi:Ca-activated chloride channel family protein
MNLESAAILKAKDDGTVIALQGVRANGRLSGMLLDVSVEQRYRNPAGRNIEVVYTFPLAWGAVLLGFDVTIGGRKLSAVCVEKKAAERRYEKALAKGDSPIMLERAADGLYTVNLGNLMAGEEATITYRYAQPVGAEQGHLRLTLPTVIAPRYGNPRDSGKQPHQVPQHSLHAEYPFSIRIEVVPPLADVRIQSPSHPVTIERKDGSAWIMLAREAALDRDFILTFDGLPSLSAAAVASDGAQVVAMASFCPALGEPQAAAPRALKMLVDCSGSMQGDSIQVAKRALHEILSRLRPEDTFSLSRFGSSCEHLFDGMQQAQGKPLADAKACLAGMRANLGGTEMEQALAETYRLEGPADSADILLITDGEIQATDSLVALARTHGQRIFAVGVGSAPAESLLRSLAEATGGACEFVAPGDQIEAAAVRMFNRMLAPAAGEVSVQWPAEPLWTAGVPVALYRGDTIHVYAAFKKQPQGEVVLRFKSSKEERTSATLHGAAAGSDALPRIAASVRLKDGLPAAEALAVAVKYQLVTSQTNLIVVHKRAAGEKAQDLPELAIQDQMLAAGWGGTSTVGEIGSFLSDDLGDSYDTLSVDAFSHQKLAGTRNLLPAAAAAPLAKPSAGKERSPKEFLAALAWDGGNAQPRLPETFSQLAQAGVPEEVCDELRKLAAGGIDERVVVAAFLAALLASAVAQSIDRHLARAAQGLEAIAAGNPALRKRMTQVMTLCGSHNWPDREAWRAAPHGNTP